MKRLLLMLTVALLALNAGAQATIFSEDFETGVLPADWTVIDADGDGQSWELFYQSHLTNYDGYSYASYSQNKTPDNWLVTPAISLGTSSSLTFWRLKGYSSTSEHYGVYVSTTSATDTSSFTLLYEETPPFGAAWVEKTVDLSAYSNSTVYIAFRHYNCTNQWAIIIDEIEVTSTLSAPTITATPASLHFDDVLAGNPSDVQTVTVNAYNVTGLVTATVSAPFELSTDSLTFTTSATLTSADHDLYVRYYPTYSGADTGVVNITGGTASASVTLYGNAISCDIPAGLAVSGVTSTSATLHWTGSADTYHIYYKAASDTDWTAVEFVTFDSTGYLLDNLTPSTTYTWYVTAICGDGTTINSVGTSTFTTGCAAFTPPFEQDFNSSSSLPQCWGHYNSWASDVFAGSGLTSTTSGWNFYNTNVFGAYHARLNIYGTSCSKWLVTPSIDLNGLTFPVLTFDLALTEWNSANPITNPGGQPDDRFMVIVSTDDGATWSAANATVWSNDSTGDFVYDQIPSAGTEITINLTNYIGQTVRIAFYGESTVTNGDNDLHIDNVRVINGSTCAKPSNLTVIAVTGTSVTLDWVENGTASAWNIEYGPSGYQQGSAAATLVPATTSPFTVDNLTLGAYDFYVQADCGSDQSLWLGPVTVTPGSYSCGASGTDTLTTCSALIYDNGGANGNYAASCNYTLIIFPDVVGNVITVSGTYHTETCCDYLRIYDGAGTNGQMLGEYKGTGSVPTLVSSTGPLTIYFYSDYALQYEGFELNVSCLSCAPPGNLTVSNIGPDSADLAWTGSYSTYTVEYKAAQDTSWTTQTVADTAFTLVGLTETTTYTVRVYGDCDGTPSPVATATFTTTMAPVALPYSTDFSGTSDWLLNNGTCGNYWTIGSISDTTDALFITHNGNTPGYSTSSFSVVTAEKLFTVGDVAEFEISFDVRIGGESEFDYLKVFFAPADTMYPAINTNVSYADGWYSFQAVNFTDYLQYSTYDTLPYKFNLTGGNMVHVAVVMPNPNANVSANTTAKLVFLWKNDQTDGTQPGAVISHVSVEALTCPPPMNLSVSNIAVTTADVAWSAAGSDDEWTLEYREEGTSAWTSVPVSGTPAYNLTGLSLGTTYEVRVQAVCSANDHSLWVSTTFTTDTTVVLTDPTVTTLAATNISQTSATLLAVIINPDNVPITATGFQWKATNGGSYTPVAGTVTGSSFSADLTGLTANTAYTFRAFITYNGTTVYGDEMSFTTEADSTGIESRLANSVTLYPNPANEYVEIRVDGDVNVTMMEVYDVYGKLVRLPDATPPQTRINVSGLSAGTYFVRVTTEGGVVTKTFVKR